MLRGALSLREHVMREDEGMAHGGPGDTGQVTVPNLIGMIVAEARRKGHEAALVVVSADPDGPPLGALTWPGSWIVTAQHPAPGVRLSRWDNVVIEFEELRGGEPDTWRGT